MSTRQSWAMRKYFKFVILLYLLSCFSRLNNARTDEIRVAKACREYFNTAYTHNYTKYLQFYSQHDIPSDSVGFSKWCKIITDHKITVDDVEKKVYDSIPYYEVRVSMYTKDGDKKIMERFLHFTYENGRIVVATWRLFTKNWNLFQTKHFNIYSNQVVADSIKADIDSFYEVVAQELGVSSQNKINYFLCKDREESGFLQGKRGGAGGTCFPGREKTIIAPAVSYHEIVHAITYEIADFSLDFLVEGVATYYMFIKKPWKLDSIINEMKSNNRLVPLDSLIWKFRSLPEESAYFESASFVKFLITKFDVHSFVTLYKLAKSWDDFIAALPKVYGKNLNELEKEWISWLPK